ncbi:hypothetical protein EGH24_11820 [Halonotius terrestris]|uniref:Small CPxCG-related zinc finger protein n=1 Tax=Halonotius terrestris TaxID=2487750 RepID=A0A8J8PAE5_9EURY|nr:hypothetical protein [Halonotius terrestris]TQQ79312.1 hypothetical protein EGH24_11820 [Halonotius terrestris]
MSEYDTDSSRRCNRCGTAVSRRFIRVFGMGDTVHGCLDCRPRRELSQGDAARRDTDTADGDTLTAWKRSGN